MGVRENRTEEAKKLSPASCEPQGWMFRLFRLGMVRATSFPPWEGDLDAVIGSGPKSRAPNRDTRSCVDPLRRAGSPRRGQ